MRAFQKSQSRDEVAQQLKGIAIAGLAANNHGSCRGLQGLPPLLQPPSSLHFHLHHHPRREPQTGTDGSAGSHHQGRFADKEKKRLFSARRVGGPGDTVHDLPLHGEFLRPPLKSHEFRPSLIAFTSRTRPTAQSAASSLNPMVEITSL